MPHAKLEWFQKGMEIAAAEEVASEMENLLLPLPPRPYTSRELRSTWQTRFAEEGWVMDYSLGNTNLTIPYFKDKVGVCIQLGNVCRVYADLIKLRSLFLMEKITCGVITVPSIQFSKQLGSNHADYARLDRDLEVLYRAIELPLLVLAVDGNRG